MQLVLFSLSLFPSSPPLFRLKYCLYVWSLFRDFEWLIDVFINTVRVIWHSPPSIALSSWPLLIDINLSSPFPPLKYYLYVWSLFRVFSGLLMFFNTDRVLWRSPPSLSLSPPWSLLIAISLSSPFCDWNLFGMFDRCVNFFIGSMFFNIDRVLWRSL